jgi:hypothetical protein
MIKENKTTKYLLYAIGEIILVVIGILIALQINNWNLDKVARNAELNFYKNTKQQLLDDANNIRSQIEYSSKNLEEFKYAIILIQEERRSMKDSLGLIAINLIRSSDFDRQGNIYETTVNSGDIKLLKNNQIIDGLRRIEETYMYVNRMETIHFDAVMSMVPELKQAVRFSSKTVEKEDLLYDYQFQNLFALAIRIITEKDEAYKRALKQIESLVKLMDGEINSRK